MEEQRDQGAILKELSDIKASLAVNTSETANIKQNIQEIKTDIKEIKSDFVSRREFNEKTKDVEEKLDIRFAVNEGSIKKTTTLIYWIGAILGAATLTSIVPKFISYFIPK